MKSKLIFRPIKNNFLKYTITFSAVVHLIGIFIFPSWGTVSVLEKERIIKIKAVVKPPEKPVQEKLSEPNENFVREFSKPTREKTPGVKSAKVVRPSPAEKRFPVPIHFPNQNFQPAKAIQQDSPDPHPVASFQKFAELKIPPTRPASLRMEPANKTLMASSRRLSPLQAEESFINTSRINTRSPARLVTHAGEVSSLYPGGQRKYFAEAQLVEKPQAVFFNSSPTLKVNAVSENLVKKTSPLILSQNMQPLNQENSYAPAGIISSAMMVAVVPATDIQARMPGNLDSQSSTPVQRALPIFGGDTPSPPKTTSRLQMAAIPSGFIEETGKGNDGANENMGDQLGKIRRAFSSEVRTKIAQTKYYPRTARRRGFEGEPVVAFTLGNTGDLLEISINNPSHHKLLDEAALDAVRSASPYPPIPELLQVKTLRFKLPISFILEEP